MGHIKPLGIVTSWICAVRLVLAMVPGYPTAVQVGTGTMAHAQFLNCQGTEQPNDMWFQTPTILKTVVFWSGLANRRASLWQTISFRSNEVFQF
jgi:hypothetical protein